MSIINDALKKAQTELSKKDTDTPPGMEDLSTQQANSTPLAANISQEQTPKPPEANNASPDPQEEFIKRNLQYIDIRKKEQAQSDFEQSRQTEEASHPAGSKAVKPKFVFDSKNVTIVLACCLVIAGSVYYTLNTMDARSKRQALRAIRSPLQKLQASFKRTPRAVKVTKRAQGQTTEPLRPYTLAAAEKPKKDTLNLSGIVEMGNKRVALINGEIYEVGDSINDLRIVNIALDKVEVDSGGKIITLTVQK